MSVNVYGTDRLFRPDGSCRSLQDLQNDDVCTDELREVYAAHLMRLKISEQRKIELAMIFSQLPKLAMMETLQTVFAINQIAWS